MMRQSQNIRETETVCLRAARRMGRFRVCLRGAASARVRCSLHAKRMRPADHHDGARSGPKSPGGRCGDVCVDRHILDRGMVVSLVRRCDAATHPLDASGR